MEQVRASRPTRIETMSRFFAAASTDLNSALSLLSEDITWINKLPEHVPFGGEYQGHQGVVRYFAEMAEAFVLGNHDLTEWDFIEAGDTLVIVGCEKQGRALSTGKVFDLEFVWVVRFDESGRICYLREHNDTAAIGSAFLED